MKLRILELETDSSSSQGCAEIIRAALGGERSAASVLQPTAPEREPEMQAVAEIEEPQRRAPKPRKALAAPTATAPRSAPGGGDSIQTRILEVLNKKPMSSLELITALKLEPNQVYQAASYLKQKGKIDSRNDETDGTRRYFVK